MSVLGLDIVGRISICRPTMTSVLIKKLGTVCAHSPLGFGGQTDATEQSRCFDIHRCGWFEVFEELIM